MKQFKITLSAFAYAAKGDGHEDDPARRLLALSPSISEARYRAGVDSFLVSLDAQRTAYSAQQQLVTTRLSSASNLVELYRSLGGGIN